MRTLPGSWLTPSLTAGPMGATTPSGAATDCGSGGRGAYHLGDQSTSKPTTKTRWYLPLFDTVRRSCAARAHFGVTPLSPMQNARTPAVRSIDFVGEAAPRT